MTGSMARAWRWPGAGLAWARSRWGCGPVKVSAVQAAAATEAAISAPGKITRQVSEVSTGRVSEGLAADQPQQQLGGHPGRERREQPAGRRGILPPVQAASANAAGRRHSAPAANITASHGPAALTRLPHGRPRYFCRTEVTVLELAAEGTPPVQPPGRAGVATHQLLIAVLGAAQQAGRRGAVLAELLAAARHRGAYRDSAEELTPLRGDVRAATPLALAAVATVIRPASWHWFVADSVRNYALTPEGWRQLLARQQAP